MLFATAGIVIASDFHWAGPWIDKTFVENFLGPPSLHSAVSSVFVVITVCCWQFSESFRSCWITLQNFFFSSPLAYLWSVLFPKYCKNFHLQAGALAVVLAISQPINALFRCPPGHKHRHIFNDIHHAIGKVAFVLAGRLTYFSLVYEISTVSWWLVDALRGFR